MNVRSPACTIPSVEGRAHFGVKMTPFLDDFAAMKIGPCEFSPDRKYRYLLKRVWDEQKPILAVVMLNPSIANEERLDPTITRVVKRACWREYGGVFIHTLFALVSTDPKGLYSASDPTGPRCDVHIQETLARYKPDTLVAWGPRGKFQGREQTVLKLLYDAQVNLLCLGLTKDCFPRHPLHVAYSVPFGTYCGRFAQQP